MGGSCKPPGPIREEDKNNLVHFQIKGLFSRLAAGTDRSEQAQANENELISDYDNIEAEIILNDTFKAVQKNKRKKKG